MPVVMGMQMMDYSEAKGLASVVARMLPWGMDLVIESAIVSKT